MWALCNQSSCNRLLNRSPLRMLARGRPSGWLMMVEFRRLLDLWEVQWARWVAVFAEKDGIHLEGHSSMTAFLKLRCRMSGARAQRSVILANKLPTVPFVGKALETGDLSLDQARVFTNLPDHLSQDLVRDEVSLVNAVEPLSVSDTRRMVEYWSRQLTVSVVTPVLRSWRSGAICSGPRPLRKW